MKRFISLLLTMFMIFGVILLCIPYAHAIGHYGIPGTVDGCNVCHDFAGGFYDAPDQGNLRWIKSTINSRPVNFTQFSDSLPAEGTLADGNETIIDGPCEVCHTTTRYHKNSGDGVTHFDGQNCAACHPHFADDIMNYFEPRFTGTQSHITHWTDPKGPQLGEDTCTFCHYPGDYSKFGSMGVSLESSDVCDECHSPDGTFDGVIEAKNKWEEGVYTTNGSGLKTGNENWCATCHDNGVSLVNSVLAPNVMGDNSSYGYNVSGHGLYSIKCVDCHDLSSTHTDSVARTYSASHNNYKAGYRLNKNMAVPRAGELSPVSFSLCFNNCHIYSNIFGDDKSTNFRDENRGLQYHKLHLDSTAGFSCWDSDWNYSVDSGLSCTACHNVHGSPTAVMTRHGELISTPGTVDKVPALDFRWYQNDGITQTAIPAESRYGSLQGGGGAKVFNNYICIYCHPDSEIRYYRIPGGGPGIGVINVWTTDSSEIVKTVFSVGDDIRYHVSFQIFGQGSYFVKAARAKAKSTSDIYWETKLKKSGTLSAGTYTWTWDKTIPSIAAPGSEAKVVIPIKVFDTPGGIVLSKDKKGSHFSISP